jgi:DNA-binding NarL/FixJ family response regulator
MTRFLRQAAKQASEVIMPRIHNGEAYRTKEKLKMSTIKMIIFIPHPGVRLGVRRTLEREPDILIVGEATDFESARKAIQKASPEVLLLDVDTPLIDINEYSALVRKQSSPIRILGISAFDDPGYIIGCFSEGINGYLLKDELTEEIGDAVRTLASGEERWMSEQVAEILKHYPDD